MALAYLHTSKADVANPSLGCTYAVREKTPIRSRHLGRYKEGGDAKNDLSQKLDGGQWSWPHHTQGSNRGPNKHRIM